MIEQKLPVFRQKEYQVFGTRAAGSSQLMDTPDPLIYWNTWKTKILDIVDCRMWWRVKVA